MLSKFILELHTPTLSAVVMFIFLNFLLQILGETSETKLKEQHLSKNIFLGCLACHLFSTFYVYIIFSLYHSLCFVYSERESILYQNATTRQNMWPIVPLFDIE